MTFSAVKITVGQSLGDGKYSSSFAGPSAPDVATLVTDTAAVEAAVAVLEADGASPTQAHVDSLRTVWDAQAADVAAVNTATSANVVVTWDASVVTTKNQLRAALKAALAAVDGGHGALT